MFTWFNKNVPSHILHKVYPFLISDILPRVYVTGIAYSKYYAGEVGVEGGEDCVLIFVDEKKPEILNKLPKEIHGVKTIVMKGDFYILKSSQEIPKIKCTHCKIRPLIGGISIGCQGIGAGTLGCVVYDVFTGEPLILSNNHVLGLNWGLCRWGEGKEGSLPILQPGPLDIPECIPRGYTGLDCPELICSEDVASEFIVGYLHRTVRVYLPYEDEGQPGCNPGENVIDAAVAKPISPDIVKPLVVNYIGKVGEEIKEADVGMKVKKCGRTTNLTFGKVFAINAVLHIRGWGRCTFVNQIVIDYDRDRQTLPIFGLPGDSGSLIVDDTPNNNPVGLLFASSRVEGRPMIIANPINAVCEILKITFTPRPTTPPVTTPRPLTTMPPRLHIVKSKIAVKVKP